MDHDAIVGASEPMRPSLEAEAKRVADAAAKALKRSRDALRGRSVSVPTWTGCSGAAGAPQRFGQKASVKVLATAAMHSSNLLQRIQEERLAREAAASANNGNIGDERAVRVESDEEKLLSHIHAYLLERPGRSASSADLVKDFERKIDSSTSALFRQFLKSIATLQFDAIMREKVWCLKPEFQ